MTPRHLQRLWQLATLPTAPRPPVGVTPADVVWHHNKLRLLRYRPRAAGLALPTPVLLVPSLINRHYVLDLTPGKSLAAWLVDQGFDVFCLDWGAPGREDADLDLDDIVLGLLGHAVRRVASQARQQGGDGRVHLLGYCMGGMLTAMLAARRPDEVASMVAVATPVALGDDGGLLRAWAQVDTLDLEALVAATGAVPAWLLQGAFQLLRPTLQLSKAVHLVDRAWRPGFVASHLAMEAWANDNVALPGAFFRRYIQEIYRDDALARGTLSLGGAPLRLQEVRAPTLAVVFGDDHIAPAASCRVLLELIGSERRELLELSGSHVGGVVSAAAGKRLWPVLAAWWMGVGGGSEGSGSV